MEIMGGGGGVPGGNGKGVKYLAIKSSLNPCEYEQKKIYGKTFPVRKMFNGKYMRFKSELKV